MSDLDRLLTEQSNPATERLDQLSSEAILERLNDEDRRVALAVRRALPQIARAVDLAVDRWNRGGRIVLFGVGTSGRLAMLDAAELRPTFGVPPERYCARMAGGMDAFQRAIEGLEDDPGSGAVAAADLNERDLAFGIAASGRTPWVVGALASAKGQGAATVALAGVPEPVIGRQADVIIVVETGPEAIAGSTRMKAGTAQKLVLNSFSTALMVRLGKVYGNLMVDVQPSNVKLRRRAVRLVEQIAMVDAATAERVLDEAGDLKVAIVALRLSLPVAAARARVVAAEGHLRRALGEG